MLQPRPAVTFADSATGTVTAFDTVDDVARATAPLLEQGRVAISGGSTYAALFPLWALRVSCPSRAQFFPVDERLVALEHPDSNWGAAVRLLLRPLGRDADKANFPASAAQYTTRLKEVFGAQSPVFDTVFLGVGDDGHTASLFPGTDWARNAEGPVLQTRSPKPPHDRVTLSPAVIAAARTVVVVVSGTGKAAVTERILAGDPSLPLVAVLSRRASSQVYIQHTLLPHFSEVAR
jgi:6-phosphogluconolactonase